MGNPIKQLQRNCSQKCEICWELLTAPIMRASKAVTQTKEPLQTWEWILKLPKPTNSIGARYLGKLKLYSNETIYKSVESNFHGSAYMRNCYFLWAAFPWVFFRRSSKENMIEFWKRNLLQQHQQTSLSTQQTQYHNLHVQK